MRISELSFASLRAAESIRRATSEIAEAQQRISTGVRLNSAADGTADIGKVSRLTSEIQKFVQNSTSNIFAQRLVETADLAHKSIQELLDSMLTTANKSVLSTASASNRESNQTSVSGLIKEVDTVAQTTSFSGQNLTDGTYINKKLLGGSGNSSVSISINSLKASAIGTNTTTLASKAASNEAGATADGAFNLVGKATKSIDYAGSASAETIAGLINAVKDDTRVTAAAETKAKLKTLSNAGTITFSLNGVSSGNIVVSSTSDLTAITTAINAISSTTGVDAETSTDKTFVTLRSSTGKNIVFAAFNNDNGGVDTIQLAALDRQGNEVNTHTITNTDGSGTAIAAARGYVVMNSENAFSYAMTAASGTDFTSASSAFKSVSAIDVSTKAGAEEAKDVISTARETVVNQRTTLGGVGNRLKFSEDYNQSQITSLSTARGNIVDADIAKESSRLASATILLESASAMLAQANISKELLLNLLISPYGARFR
ncbi:MAG: flagellin [Rhodospirillaceae bacterium]